jgi:hypothetical protein
MTWSSWAFAWADLGGLAGLAGLLSPSGAGLGFRAIFYERLLRSGYELVGVYLGFLRGSILELTSRLEGLRVNERH